MTSAGQVAADLGKLAVQARARAHGVVVAFGAQLNAEAMRNASGRPGPEAVTGNLRRSINRHTTMTVTVSQCEVGSSAPQARRLELGFHGTDALGRRYNQPPYPFLGPALEAVEGPFAEALAVAVAPMAGDIG